MRNLSTLAASFVVVVCLGSAASADVIISFAEVGSDVIVTVSGSLDLTDLLFDVMGVVGGAGVAPATPSLFMGTDGPLMDSYIGATNAPFGTGGTTVADTSTGDRFVVTGAAGLAVPTGYISGTAMSGTQTYLGTTIAALGITPGTTIVSSWGSGATASSISVTTAVPEPSSYALAMLCLLSVAVRRRRS